MKKMMKMYQCLVHQNEKFKKFKKLQLQMMTRAYIPVESVARIGMNIIIGELCVICVTKQIIYNAVVCSTNLRNTSELSLKKLSFSVSVIFNIKLISWHVAFPIL